MLQEITSTDLSDFIWQFVGLCHRFDFYANTNATLDTQKATEFSAAMLLVAGQTTIVVNAYGGGKPFIFTVGKSEKEKARFMEQFEAYLKRAGNYFWLENSAFEISRSWKPQPLEIGLREFANILLENSDKPLEIRFEKPEKEPHDPYSHEQFTFVFTDVAEAIVGVCNSDSRVMPFCGDVYNDACIGSFVSNFVNYLKSCGFRKNVRAYGNGFNRD